MLGTKTKDQDNQIDWGKTSEDYARHRPGPPPSFYQKLKAHDIGLKGQKILDLGTGTGVLARSFAKEGCQVTGVDISENQILMARELANKDSLKVDFFTCPAEDISFPENSFDIITANQCFLYFDREKLIPLIKKILKPNGLFVTSHFSWMPFLDEVAKKTEELILKFNPNWSAHSYRGEIPPFHSGLEKDFRLKGFFYYDEEIDFTREDWMGRIRACRGVAASLDSQQVLEFDSEHEKLLKSLTKEKFSIIHRIDAHIMTPL